MEGSKAYTIDERMTMLRVPDLKPDEEPFDPDREYQMHSKIQQSNHMLRIGGGDDAVAKDGAMLSGLAHDETWGRPANPEESQELQAIRKRNATFDDATVRSALTDLHERGDDFERRLSELPGRQASDIGKFTDSFLKEQRERLASQMTNDQQKRHFEFGFGIFSGETLMRSKAVREEKTRAWQSEVTERQNQVFLNRALRTDAVFNDEAQTGFRNMYLPNVDNLHADLPEAERKAKIDAANSDFCKQVLDKRLELDPAKMRTMLDAPAVRRVLGDEMMKTYEAKAALAVRNDEIGRLAKDWSDSGTEQGEAERTAFKLYPDESERGFALEQYRNLRENASREVVTQNLLHIDKTWREVRESGVGDNPRLGVLRHTDPDLAAHMEKALLDQRKNGGAPAKPDYALLLRLTDDFDPRQSAENLRDRSQLLDVYSKLGGSESPELSTYLRSFLGKSTPEDANRLDSLRLARDIATVDRGADISDAEMSGYLHQYSENARIYMDRNGYKELDYSEKSMLARKTMNDMGWGKGNVSSNGREDDADSASDEHEKAKAVADMVEQGRYMPPDEIINPKLTDLSRAHEMVDTSSWETAEKRATDSPGRRPAEILQKPPINRSRRYNQLEFTDIPAGMEPIVNKNEWDSIEKSFPWNAPGATDRALRQGHASPGIDNSRNKLDNDPMLPPPVTQEELLAPKTPEGRPVLNRGQGKIANFHGDWGTRFNIQSDGVVKNLNKFLQDPRTHEFFPEGTKVRPHPNGDSLVWEWQDKAGNLVRWQQTARPSWQISAKDKIGGGYVAEETPWGFMATKKFDEMDDRDKGSIIAHEAYHQMMQIGEQGKIRYLIDIRGQLVGNIAKNTLKSRGQRTRPDIDIVTNSYYEVRQEEEAYQINDLYDGVIE